MIVRNFALPLALPLAFTLALTLPFAVPGAGVAPAAAQGAPTAALTADSASDPVAADGEKSLAWKDYKVKAYSLSIFGGHFSGATYLDLKPLTPQTFLTPGAGDILGYDGNVLTESLDPPGSVRKYTGARKEIEAGTAIGGRIGVYVADDFHLDLLGNYMSGRAVTTMLHNPDPVVSPDNWTRIEVDEDSGFRAFKGGLSLMYDARPAKFLGMTPMMGFGLGGVLNRYTALADKAALYLEGNFGISVQPMDNLRIIGRADVAVFAFDVDELGYSNMVTYRNLTVGAAWFLDRVPADVRAKHETTKRTRR
jgi:hypothetical protein